MTSLYSSITFNNTGQLFFPANTEKLLDQSKWQCVLFADNHTSSTAIGKQLLPSESQSFIFPDAIWDIQYYVNVSSLGLMTGETATCNLRYLPGPNSTDTPFDTSSTFSADSTNGNVFNIIRGNSGDQLAVTWTFSADKTVDFDVTSPCAIRIQTVTPNEIPTFYYSRNGQVSRASPSAASSIMLTDTLVGNSVRFYLTQDGTATGKPRLQKRITSKTISVSTNSGSAQNIIPPSLPYWLEDDSTETQTSYRTLVFGNSGSSSVEWKIACTFQGI